MAGLLLGVLGLGACWATFWGVVLGMGVNKGTCRPRLVINALGAALLQLVLLAGLMTMLDQSRFRHPWLWLGVVVVPALLVWSGMRRLPDGRRSGLAKLAELHRMVRRLLHGSHH